MTGGGQLPAARFWKRMKAEHWTSDESDTLMVSVLPEELYPRNEPGSRLCCIIEAETYEALMTKYCTHMNWGEYQPIA